ncbi:sulfate transporter CysZ [Flocculibacter collagenilyticus]|uniref:sulfate transporter CysZ n=1 Tax=Flocculibacter collagenilyticus TaxID=2744479 RepID=UPI0018F71F9C|nr:sulfate transporter CysZ [Flocculibacter collagenilyticus]
MQQSGASYLISGLSLITTKGLKRFVLIPLSVNLILFAAAFYFLFLQLEQIFVWLDSYIPDWLSWIHFLLWPLAIIVILMAFSYIFSAVANWIAAPFNGLLAEKVEQHLTGHMISDAGFTEILKDVPRTLSREWQKLAYYIPRAIGFFILQFFIPVVGQLIWFLFIAWNMAIQYCDYSFDNHKVPFHHMKSQLAQRKGLSYGFGITTTLFSMIPFVNLIVMPVAICGATNMWVKEFREDNIGSTPLNTSLSPK